MSEAWSVLLVLAVSAVLAAIAAIAASRRAIRERERADRLRQSAAELELRAQLAKRGAEIQSANAAALKRRVEALTARDPTEPDDALVQLSPRELRHALRRSNEDYVHLVTRQLVDEATHERRVRELLDRIQAQGKLITSLVEALAETTAQLESALGTRLRVWDECAASGRAGDAPHEAGSSDG
ncbi:MAG: hypothetical protein AB1689_14155 [Thermodesulfobacteriota bacterium]